MTPATPSEASPRTSAIFRRRSVTQEFVEEAEKDEQLKAATAAFQAKAPKAEEDGAALLKRAAKGGRRAAKPDPAEEKAEPLAPERPAGGGRAPRGGRRHKPAAAAADADADAKPSAPAEAKPGAEDDSDDGDIAPPESK